MNKMEFALIAKAMRTYYPKERIIPNDEAMVLWYDQLSDLDYMTTAEALKKWVRVNKWSPSIADIREAVEHTRIEKEVGAVIMRQRLRLAGRDQRWIETEDKTEINYSDIREAR